MQKTTLLICALLLLLIRFTRADDGYRLWLKYDQIPETQKLQEYRERLSGIMVTGQSATMNIVGEELHTALKSLLGRDITQIKSVSANTVIAGQ